MSQSESARTGPAPDLDFPGRPAHALPFLLYRKAHQVRAVLASGEKLNLTRTIPRMVELALDATHPRLSMAATLREARVTLSTEEREAILACATRVLRAAQAERREYLSLAEASQVLGVPVAALRALLETEEGRRLCGYPIMIGDVVRIPAPALRPSERTAFLESLDQ